MTEKIRQLTNKVTLAGALAELDHINEGTTQNGVPYISFSGVLQCGADQVYQIRFKTFVKSKKSDGTDSKNFANVKKWVQSAVPMTQDPENPTMVEAVGSLTDHPYVNKENKLIEATEFSLQFFGPFNEYRADIDLEGFVHSIVDETKGEEDITTGRKRMRLISRDIFSNMIDLKSLVIPKELVEPIEDNGYEKGCTAKFFFSLKPNDKVSAPKGGIGIQRVDGGKPYLEWILTGAEPVIDSESERALDAKLIKAGMVERQSHLDEVKAAGYLGNKSSDNNSYTPSPTNRTGFGGNVGTMAKREEKTYEKPAEKKEPVESKKADDDDDEDDFPF